MDFRELTDFALELAHIKVRPAQIWNGMKFAFDYLIVGPKNSNVVNYFPVSFGILINMKCNLRCDFCFIDWNDKSYATEHIEVERFKELLDAPIFSRAIRLTIAGGEPLLHPKYCELTEIARGKRLYTSSHTNGLLIKRCLDKLSSSSLNSLNVSMYDEHQDEQFGQIAALLDSNRRNRSRMRVSISRVISAENYEEMDQFMTCAKALGIKYVLFLNYYDGTNMLSSKCIYESNAGYFKFLEDFKQRHRNSGIQYLLPAPLRRDRLTKGHCPSLFGTLTVDARGNIAPCCFIIPPKREYGNALTDKDAWNNKFYTGLRSAMLSPDVPLGGECTTCSQLGNDILKVM